MTGKTEATRLADAPERIWLQVCGDDDCVEPFAAHDGVTWCQDKVHDTDIEYVRADRAAPPAESERGHVVVTRTQDGHLAAVTRQDDEHRILSVIADTNSLRERIAALEAALAERDRVIEIAQEMAEYLRNSSICQADTEAAEEVIRAIEEVQR